MISQKWIALVAALLFSLGVSAREQAELAAIGVGNLPVEAQDTLVLIKRNGPFPFAKDGAVFGNYEQVLPKQKRGYYHEYTVLTPGVRGRGARRLIAGGISPGQQQYYYTDNHYRTFKRIQQ